MEEHKHSQVCNNPIFYYDYGHKTNVMHDPERHMLPYSNSVTPGLTAKNNIAISNDANIIIPHRLNNEPIYACPLCDHTCPTSNEMKAHMNHHNVSGFLVCEEKDCPFKCNSTDELFEHKKSHQDTTAPIADQSYAGMTKTEPPAQPLN